MLQIGQCPKESLHTILEENLDSESQGSTKIVTKTAAVRAAERTVRAANRATQTTYSDHLPWCNDDRHEERRRDSHDRRFL